VTTMSTKPSGGLKKKIQRGGLFREINLRKHYEKPSEKRVRDKAEAVRRARKLARKKLQREGLRPRRSLGGSQAREEVAHRTPLAYDLGMTLRDTVN